MLLDDGGTKSFREVIQLGMKFFLTRFLMLGKGRFETPSRMITQADGKRHGVRRSIR